MRTDSRRTLALRGLLLIVLLAGSVLAIVTVNQTSASGQPVVTTVMPATVGPVQAGTPVEFHGVNVGTLSAVAATPAGSRLTLRINPARISAIPAQVQTRLLPLTLFGNSYIDLVPGANPGAGARLRPGAVLLADTSAPTVNLYQAYTRFARLLSAVDPAQLDMALTATADALRGRGAQIGHIIDELHTATTGLDPQLTKLISQLPTAAAMTRNLARSAPDLMQVMRNAVAESSTVLDEQRNIAALLSVGTRLENQAGDLMNSDGGEAVQMLYKTAPLVSALSARPGAVTGMLGSAQAFLNAANPVFSSGSFNMAARASLDDPYPYTSANCPHYPGEAGPNCGQSGAAASTSDTSLSDLLGGPAQAREPEAAS